jgi:hypothetical protein
LNETVDESMRPFRHPGWKEIIALTLALTVAVAWMFLDLHVCVGGQSQIGPKESSPLLVLGHTRPSTAQCQLQPSDFDFLAAESGNWANALGLPNRNAAVWETPEARDMIEKRRTELLRFWNMERAGGKGTGLEEWHHAVIIKHIQVMLGDAENWVEIVKRRLQRKKFDKEIGRFHEDQKKRFDRYLNE